MCSGSCPPTFSCSEPHEDVHTLRPFHFPRNSYSPLSQRLHAGSLHSVCDSKTYLDGWQDVSKQFEPTSISQEISSLKKTYFQKQKGSPSTSSRNADMGLHFCLAVELSSCQPTGWYSVHLALVPRAVSTNPPIPPPLPSTGSYEQPGLCKHSCPLIHSVLALLNESGLTPLSPPHEFTTLGVSSNDLLLQLPPHLSPLEYCL